MKPADAERVLRNSLAIWERKEPESWRTFDVRSLLGEALFRQQMTAKAEPLLMSGYEGLKQREATMNSESRARLLKQAGDRIVKFYEASGKAEQAAEWRKRQLQPAAGPANVQP